MSWNADLYKEKHAFVFQYGNGLIDWLQPQSGEKILDLGCGTGELTARLAASGAKVTGLDSSAGMIESARRNFPEAEFIVADAAAFTLPEQFDAVFSNAALHWMQASGQVAARMYQHLKPGGRLVLEMGAKGNVNSLLRGMENVMRQYGYTYRPYWYFPSLGEYTSLLERSGFRIQQAHCFERATELADPENGIIEWMEMFGSPLLQEVAPGHRAPMLQQLQEELKPACYRNGRWYLDYVRLRIAAVK
jgi:trans-aconitate methyltransferase